MTDTFQNKYRIPSARAQWWNYGNAATYFITICAHNREHYFGEIENGDMILNDIGRMTHEEWLKTPDIRPDMNLTLGDFVVMPNHFHAIIVIGENKYNNGDGRIGGAICRDAMHCVSTAETETNTFAPQSKNLASIVRGFKSSVTTRTKKMGYENFAWQTRFHDHIIRNQKSFDTISNYIINNPNKWTDDTFYN